MYSVYSRRKSRPLVILLTLLFLWSQLGLLASPAHAATAKPPSVSQEVYAFKDITPAQSDYIFINYLKKAGLISGFSDGTFRPQAGLTRAEVATVLVKAGRLKTETAETGFKDVSTKHWAAKNIAAAKNAGLLSGYPNGTFRPEAMLTRAEGITLVLKLSKQADSGVDLPTLTDVSSKHWAARSIATGLAAEMVSLSSDKKSFLPNTKFSRGSFTRSLAILITRDPGLYQTILPNLLTVTKGTVHVTRANSTSPEIISSNTPLNIGDSLTVDQGSSAKLDFPDGTGLRLEQNSTITIKDSKGRSYIKPDGSPGIAVESLNVDMKSGQLFGALASSAEAEGASSETASTKVRAASLASSKTITTAAATAKPLPWWKQTGVKRTKVKVDMPTGVAAIRGTFWENQVSTDGSFKTTLLTGDAEVTSSGGQNVSLTAGQRTEVTTPTAPPAPPAPLTVADKQEWVQVATWAQEQSAVIVQNQEQKLPPPPPVVPEAPKPPKPQTPQPQAPKPQTPQPPTPKPPVPVPNKPKDITHIVFDALSGAGATNLTNPDELKPSSMPEIPIPPPLTKPTEPTKQDPPPPPPPTDSGGDSGPSIVSVPVSFLNLNATQINNLVVGGSPAILIPIIAPSDATNKAVTWSSSNPGIVDVVNGVVVPRSAGTTTITAISKDDPTKTATCQVTVVLPPG